MHANSIEEQVYFIVSGSFWYLVVNVNISYVV